MKKCEVSIIIRTLNEEKYLSECIENIEGQRFEGSTEIIVVDSGSIDQTLNIAERYGVRVVHIDKVEFTFGRSLNFGCKEAKGNILVFISAHCIPAGNQWLKNLCAPIISREAAYVYGRQIIRESVSNVSEKSVFEKYYPAEQHQNILPFFANNANAALSKEVWENFKFDETLTGLEDIALGKALVANGIGIKYAPCAVVEHIHAESWRQIRNRYEREAVAMQTIDESLSLSFWEAIYCFIVATFNDLMRYHAGLPRTSIMILIYRSAQFYGTYYGGRLSRKKVNEKKFKYFYPS